MTDSTNLSEGQAAQPHPDLTSLDKLVDSWVVSGEAERTVVYEWTEGGFFLLQHVDLGGNKGLEVIGHEHRYGEDPSTDIRSRYYGFSEGETLDYTYEIKGRHAHHLDGRAELPRVLRRQVQRGRRHAHRCLALSGRRWLLDCGYQDGKHLRLRLQSACAQKS
jgi:hypothetical protein